MSGMCEEMVIPDNGTGCPLWDGKNKDFTLLLSSWNRNSMAKLFRRVLEVINIRQGYNLYRKLSRHIAKWTTGKRSTKPTKYRERANEVRNAAGAVYFPTGPMFLSLWRGAMNSTKKKHLWEVVLLVTLTFGSRMIKMRAWWLGCQTQCIL